jgi:hypothetical protein
MEETARLCKLQKGCTRLEVTSDKVHQLLARGRRFSPGAPASSTTKTGRHDIAEILLKVALNTKNQIKSIFRFVDIVDHQYLNIVFIMIIMKHFLRICFVQKQL